MRRFVTIVLTLVWAPGALGDHRHCLGPGDLDADHVVGLTDLQLLSTCMGGPTTIAADACSLEIANSADIDLDGDRDLADFAVFARRFGQTYFDYGPERLDKEAEYHAITLTGQLRAPAAEYARISRDLMLIREVYADLVDIRNQPVLPNNDLFVRLWSIHLRDDFDFLNEYFVYSSSRAIVGDHVFYVEFCDVVYSHALVEIYEESDQVEYAHGNIAFCIPSCCWNRVVVSVESNAFTYDFSFYYDRPDSFVSCGCWRTRLIQVDEAGTISQLSCEDSCLPDCP